MSVDRCLSVQFKKWRSSIFKNKTAAITSALIATGIFFFNFHLVFTIDYSKLVNDTNPGKCFYTEMFLEWKMV